MYRVARFFHNLGLVWARSPVALLSAVFLAACSEGLPVEPSPGAGFNAGRTALPAPTDLRATFDGAGGSLLLSWTHRYDPYHGVGVAGFLVESARDSTGAWSIRGFTRANHITDGGGADGRCYRVTAVSSAGPALDSPPSDALCLAASASGA